VGDSDVGKDEILNNLDDDNSISEPSFCRSPGMAYKATNILLDGRRIRLQLWDTSGQGRFSTIFRSYSRGAQGVLIVYDITNKWSFAGLDRWLREVEEHAPGVPKILVGNRLHLAFRRQVSEYTAETYAKKHKMTFFEVSPLCNYNIKESCAELSRMALQRNGMEKLWKNNMVLSLQELCCRTIVARTSHPHTIEQLPLPSSLKSCLKSYSSMSNYHGSWRPSRQQYKSPKEKKTIKKRAKTLFTCDITKALSSNFSSITNTTIRSDITRQQNHSRRNRFCSVS